MFQEQKNLRELSFKNFIWQSVVTGSDVRPELLIHLKGSDQI